MFTSHLEGRKYLERDNIPYIIIIWVIAPRRTRRLFIFDLRVLFEANCRSQWPCGLRRRSSAARLLRLWVRTPPGGMDVCLL